MNHGKKLAVTVAFDVYLECCEGNLHPLWKTKPVSFHRFREKLGLQMVQYSPSNQHYPGDERLRANTVLPKKRRRPLLSPSRSVNSVASTASGISASFLAEESNKGRLCGFLGQLNEHLESVVSIPNKGKQNCHVCGDKAHQLCSLCKVPLHCTKPPKDDSKSINVPCFFLYHDTGFCGLARADWKKLGSPVNDWKLKKATVEKHSSAIRDLRKTMATLNNSSSNKADSSGGDNNNTEEWNDRCV